MGVVDAATAQGRPGCGRALIQTPAPTSQCRLWFRARACWGPMSLSFAARDETHNDAVVLRDVLLGRQAEQQKRGAQGHRDQQKGIRRGQSVLVGSYGTDAFCRPLGRLHAHSGTRRASAARIGTENRRRRVRRWRELNPPTALRSPPRQRSRARRSSPRRKRA